MYCYTIRTYQVEKNNDKIKIKNVEFYVNIYKNCF